MEDPQKTIARMKGVLETLYAIELLEYHDKNWLAYQSSPKTFSEEKQALIRHGLHTPSQEDPFGKINTSTIGR